MKATLFFSSSKEAQTSHSVITSNSTSDIRYNKKFQAGSEQSTNSTKEGCFCPEDTTLFNTVYSTCVTSCGKRRAHRRLNLTRSRNIFHKSISRHTYTFTNTCFILNFRLCWTWRKTQTGEKWCLTNTVFTGALAKPELCVSTSSFLLISLVTHGPATATHACVTRIPWVSIVSLFSAHRCGAPTAASLATNWSTRQKTAALRSHAVSCSLTKPDANRFVNSKFCHWQRLTHRLPFHAASGHLMCRNKGEKTG